MYSAPQSLTKAECAAPAATRTTRTPSRASASTLRGVSCGARSPWPSAAALPCPQLKTSPRCEVRGEVRGER